jgi:hypothetical protein
LPDPAALEFYKLAAQVIPVLWIGTVLQRLSADPLRDELRRRKDEAARTLEEAMRLFNTAIQAVADLRGREPEEHAGTTEQVKLANELMNTTLERVQKLDVQDVEARARRKAALRTIPYAITAVLIAAVSEALALYGVAAPHTSWAVTAAVATGLATGGALLLGPLVIGWLQIWRQPHNMPTPAQAPHDVWSATGD